MRVEAGVHSQVQANVIIADSTAASGTGVGAQLVRCLIGQRERVAVVSVVDAGSSSGALSCIVQGSAEGTTWVSIGTAVVAETAGVAEIVMATPHVRLFITTQGSPAWEFNLTITE